MKNLMKVIDREGSGFIFLLEKLLRISVEIIKTGVFDGSQLWELMKDPSFDEALSEVEQSAWQYHWSQ